MCQPNGFSQEGHIRTYKYNGRLEFPPLLPAVHKAWKIFEEEVDVVGESDGNGQVFCLEDGL